MLTDFNWAEFAFAVLLIELTPGPNMAWLAALSLGEGRRAGFAATIGIAIGLTVNALLAALGLAALVEAKPAIQSALRWTGAGLMLMLAWQAWHDADGAVEETGDRPAPGNIGRHFTSGLLVNLLNPKAFVFFVAVVPPFLDGQQATLGQAMALAGVSVAIATAVHCTIVLGASHAHGWLANTKRTQQVRRAMALLMVAVAAWLAMGRVH